MEILRVKELIDEKCTGYDDGKRLFTLIDSLLAKGLSVKIDMNGVTFTSCLFITPLLASLY